MRKNEALNRNSCNLSCGGTISLWNQAIEQFIKIRGEISFSDKKTGETKIPFGNMT